MLTLLAAFARHLAARRAPRTIETYVYIVMSLTRFLGVCDLSSRMSTRAEIEAFLGRPRADARPRAPASRNQELAAIRAFSAFARRDLGWTMVPTDGIPFLREPPRDPPVLSPFELRRLFEVATAVESPTRRALALAILALLSQAALRVHELVALDVDQIDFASATLVAVRGKGGTVHDLPLNEPTLALLRAWLEQRVRVAPDGERALLLSAQRCRISIRAVEHLVANLARATGTQKRVTPHVFRHSAATIALTMGSDVSTVAELLRHADLNVTRRYLHLVDTRRREAVRRLGGTIPAAILGTNAVGGGVPDARPKPNARSPKESGTFSLDDQHGLDEAA